MGISLSNTLDPSDLTARDPEFIRRVGIPLSNWLRYRYFRTENEGLDLLPEPPLIAVTTHSGGPMLPDVWPMMSAWWERYPLEVPAHALVHDAAFKIPVVGDFLVRVGGLRASRANAERVIAAGGALMIAPGGDSEALRSFRNRNRVDLRGHTFFVELALRYGVPIVPIVNVGGHEAYFTVLSSPRLARWSGMQKLLGIKTVPINVGLPWGIWATGLVPYLPLPTKMSYRVLEPIRFPRAPELATNEHLVRDAYERIASSMQAAVSELAARRKLPVIG
jgi:1-acyl-sn-glycerol-3-phosphate acyltransferase